MHAVSSIIIYIHLTFYICCHCVALFFWEVLESPLARQSFCTTLEGILKVTLEEKKMPLRSRNPRLDGDVIKVDNETNKTAPKKVMEGSKNLVRNTNAIGESGKGAWRRPVRLCYRLYRARCKNIKRVQIDVFVVILAVWVFTLYLAFHFATKLAFENYRQFFDENLCFDSSSGEKPFAEHTGSFDFVARAQMVYEVDKVLYKNESKLGQKIEVFRNSFLGKVLVVENEIMITEKDEKHYHEMISHVPLAYLSDVENVRVLIIGGGDGGTLFQVLKHPNVRHVTMVELDESVVEVSKKFFPQFAEAYSDPRVTLIFDDGAKYVSNRLGVKYINIAEASPLELQIASQKGLPKAKPENEFDVVIVDSTDYGVAVPLFTRQFYMQVQELLNDDHGILVFNCDTPAWALPTVSHVSSLISSVFQQNYLYQVFQPTYVSGHYTFMFASDTVHPVKTHIHWDKWDAKNIDTMYYNKGVHKASFYLPQYVKQAMRHQDI